jgi:hypothetical protein
LSNTSIFQTPDSPDISFSKNLASKKKPVPKKRNQIGHISPDLYSRIGKGGPPTLLKLAVLVSFYHGILLFQGGPTLPAVLFSLLVIHDPCARPVNYNASAIVADPNW